MWMTTSGAATAAAIASRSHTSPSMLSTPSPTRASSNSDGCVAPFTEKPVTRAPSDCSQRASQAPLKPVWPVSSTRRSRQKPGSTVPLGGAVAAPSAPDACSPLTALRPYPPWSLAGAPELLEMIAVAERVHRLPEPSVAVAGELPLARERPHRPLLPDGLIAV